LSRQCCSHLDEITIDDNVIQPQSRHYCTAAPSQIINSPKQKRKQNQKKHNFPLSGT